MAATTTGRKRSNPVHQYFVIDESKTAYRCTDDDCEFTSLVKHGPTNLKLHLKKKHPEWQKQLEVKETAEKKAKTDSQSRKVTTMESFVNIAGSSSRSATTPLPASDYLCFSGAGVGVERLFSGAAIQAEGRLRMLSNTGLRERTMIASNRDLIE